MKQWPKIYFHTLFFEFWVLLLWKCVYSYILRFFTNLYYTSYKKMNLKKNVPSEMYRLKIDEHICKGNPVVIYPKISRFPFFKIHFFSVLSCILLFLWSTFMYSILPVIFPVRYHFNFTKPSRLSTYFLLFILIRGWIHFVFVQSVFHGFIYTFL